MNNVVKNAVIERKNIFFSDFIKKHLTRFPAFEILFTDSKIKIMVVKKKLGKLIEYV